MRPKVITGQLAMELELIPFWREIRNNWLYVGVVDGRRFKRAVRRARRNITRIES